MQERIVLALAILGAGGLVAYADSEPPLVRPADAAAHVGSEVLVAGFARDVQTRDGTTRFVVAAEGWGLPATTSGPPPVEGSYVEVRGRVSDFGGVVRLVAAAHSAVAPPDGIPVLPAELAAAPGSWTDTRLRLFGTVDGAWFDLGSVRVLRGTGPWPDEGRHEVVALLRHEPRCVCHVADAVEVRPWNL